MRPTSGQVRHGSSASCPLALEPLQLSQHQYYGELAKASRSGKTTGFIVSVVQGLRLEANSKASRRDWQQATQKQGHAPSPETSTDFETQASS